ncbi:MAG: DNA-protecting protein DprA, partial [Lachnospiraceae bacterium]|nr:DNA-protecting protein DprA [Lachnospiraceae bacterium]
LYEQLCERGLVISENPPGTSPLPYLFTRRNRLISGLCTSMVVVEARKKSGSLITVSYALEQGRNVYAVPGRIDDELSAGTNALILEGATPLLDPSQILKEMDISPALSNHYEEKIEKSLEKAEVLLYSFLDYEPSHIDDLAQKCGMDLSRVSYLLMQLELKGYVSQPVRNYYVKML